MSNLSTMRMQGVRDPVIPIVGEMVKSRPGTISLGQGVSYYGPPPAVQSRLAGFFAHPENHRYSLVQGIPPLLEMLAQKLWTDNQIDIGPENRIVVTAGGNMAFMNAILAIAEVDDEIILPVPYYFNHDMAIQMAGCRTVPVSTREDYSLSLENLENAVTPRTRAIVTVSPNNPSGAVYPHEDLREVNELCQRRGIYHIHDEAYEYFTYDGAVHVSPASFPESVGHTISLFSLSKSYGFAGWRIGYMVMPEHLFFAVKKIQDTILICPPVVSQVAALGALEAGRTYCEEKQQSIIRVRRILLQAFETLGDVCTLPAAGGAFYLLPRVHTTLRPMQVVEKLILEHGVAVMPGDAFGLEEGCPLRIAYGALDEHTTEEGIDRLVKGLRAIAGEG